MDRADAIRDNRALVLGAAWLGWPFAAFTTKESLGFTLPQLIRHQGMDLYDGFTIHAGASLFAWALLSTVATTIRGKDTVWGHVLPSIVGLVTVLALGMQTELWHAEQSGKPFDYPDVLAYATGALLSATVARTIHARSAN